MYQSASFIIFTPKSWYLTLSSRNSFMAITVGFSFLSSSSVSSGFSLTYFALLETASTAAYLFGIFLSMSFIVNSNFFIDLTSSTILFRDCEYREYNFAVEAYRDHCAKRKPIGTKISWAPAHGFLFLTRHYVFKLRYAFL